MLENPRCTDARRGHMSNGRAAEYTVQIYFKKKSRVTLTPAAVAWRRGVCIIIPTTPWSHECGSEVPGINSWGQRRYIPIRQVPCSYATAVVPLDSSVQTYLDAVLGELQGIQDGVPHTSRLFHREPIATAWRSVETDLTKYRHAESDKTRCSKKAMELKCLLPRDGSPPYGGVHCGKPRYHQFRR